MRFPWQQPRPSWHYVFVNGVERDYPIDPGRPVTLPEAHERIADLRSIELRLGDQTMAFATRETPGRVGAAAQLVFEVPDGALLYHGLTHEKTVGAGGSADRGERTGYVLGWRKGAQIRRMEVWVDHARGRIDIEPYPVMLGA